MAKWGKKILGLVAVGTAAAGALYYLKKKDMEDPDQFEDDFEDEDFDLDNDLKPVTDREYVPLNTVTKDAAEEEPKDNNDSEAEDEAETESDAEAESEEEPEDNEEKRDNEETEA